MNIIKGVTLDVPKQVKAAVEALTQLSADSSRVGTNARKLRTMLLSLFLRGGVNPMVTQAIPDDLKNVILQFRPPKSEEPE